MPKGNVFFKFNCDTHARQLQHAHAANATRQKQALLKNQTLAHCLATIAYMRFHNTLCGNRNCSMPLKTTHGNIIFGRNKT